MKKAILFIHLTIILLTAQSLNSQPYFNEWINYEQQYFKVKVAKPGLYSIPYTALQSTGLPLTGSGFQLFSRGEQVALFTSTEGEMATGDSLFFYATGNDGSFDTQLYANPEWQPHKIMSLFSDTITYFLTWNNEVTNSRFSLIPNDLSSPPPQDSYFLHQVKRRFNNMFHSGKPTYFGFSANFPHFEQGESFCGQSISSPFTFTLPTPHHYTGNEMVLPDFDITLLSNSYNFSMLPSNFYKVSIKGTPYFSDVLDQYKLIRDKTDVLPEDIGITNTEIGIEPDFSGSNYFHASYASFTYPREFDFDNLPYFEFSLEDNNARYIEISNFNGGTHPLLLDLSNHLVIEPVFEAGIYKLMLPQTTGIEELRRLVLLNTDSDCLYPCQIPVCNYSDCNTFEVSSLTPVTFTDYAQVSNQGNYLIITHPVLRQGSTDWVQEYANYRNSPVGGYYTVQIINVEELYDQFAWGIPTHPLSIRHFINYALDNWTIQPEYTFLVGKGISYEAIRNNPLAYNKCLVPTYGHQPADIFIVGRDAQNWLPQLPIGRLSAQTPEGVRSFYNKIVNHESPKPCTWNEREWTKKIIFAAGGHTLSDRDSMLSILQKHAAILDTSFFNFYKEETYSQASFTQILQPQFNSSFNNGSLLFNYIGEAINQSMITFDLKKEPEEYNNVYRNPLIFGNSSFIGKPFGYGSSSMSLTEKYVAADSLGAIGALAGTSIENYSYANPIYKLLLKKLFHEHTDRPFGYSLHQVFSEKLVPEAITHNELSNNLALLMLHYEGDPALQLAGSYTVPEFTLFNPDEQPDINVINPQTGIPYTSNPITLNNDTLLLQLGIGNLGADFTWQIPLLVQQTNSLGNIVKMDTFYFNAPEVLNEINVTVPVFYSELPDTLTITVSINHDLSIVEDCYDNNSATFSVITETICNPSIQPVITNVNPSYCSSGEPVELQGYPQGGTFYVNGFEQTHLNPADYEGVIEVKYEIVSGPTESCLESTEMAVQIIQTPIAQLSISDTIVCVGESVLISALLYPSATYNFSFSDGNFIAFGNQNYEIEWITPGTKLISLFISLGDCVSETFQQNISVYAPPPTPIITCGEATATSITINWSVEPTDTYYNMVYNGVPQTVTTPTFTVDGLEPLSSALFQVVAFNDNPVCNMSNPSTLVECFTDNCPSVQLSIDGLPQNICNNTEPFDLLGTPTGGYFTLNSESFSGYLEPETMEATNYSLSYHFEIAGCEYEETVLFDIHQSPNPQISITGTLCEGDNNQLASSATFSGYMWDNGQQTQTISINESGVYSLTVTDENNCSSSISVSVELLPLPQLTLPEYLEIDIGKLPYLLQSGFEQTDAQYLWSNGEINSEIYITEAGVYSVTVTDVNGCLSEASVLVDVTVGTSYLIEQSIHIYPNPVSETLYIEGVIQQNVSAYLYNSLGQLTIAQRLTANQMNSIPTHELAAGVYYLQISLPDRVLAQKVVKW